MKNLILLFLVISCASPAPSNYGQYAIEQNSLEMKDALEAFRESIQDLKKAMCVEYADDKKYQDENCKE